MTNKAVLWWGRSDSDYSRNRIIRELFSDIGWKVIDFKPRVSFLADIEAYLTIDFSEVDLVWVPCFRQRDLAAAKRWSSRYRLPLVFDPLISAYDKQVSERNKFPQTSRKAKQLLKWERSLFQMADYLVADTEQHAMFFNKTMDVDSNKLVVIPVGAEEALFFPQEDKHHSDNIQVLFYGSYIGLQGPQVIAEAIKLYSGPTIDWHFIGNGPLREKVQLILSDMENVHFTDWVPYQSLPEKIRDADLCLGVFGPTDKTRRVIANKVYQSLACGRPVLSCESEAYPIGLREQENTGLYFVRANDPKALATKLAELASDRESLMMAREGAEESYNLYFSNEILKRQLEYVLESL